MAKVDFLGVLLIFYIFSFFDLNGNYLCDFQDNLGPTRLFAFINLSYLPSRTIYMKDRWTMNSQILIEQILVLKYRRVLQNKGINCSGEDPDPVIFDLPDPVLFWPDPTCNNAYIKLFPFLTKYSNQNQHIQVLTMPKKCRLIIH